jgi:hypothetical protein
LKHTIRLHAAARPGRYPVTRAGATIVTDSDRPILDAALALKANDDAADHDMIHVAGADFQFSPTAIWKLTAPRKPPRQSDMIAQSRY